MTVNTTERFKTYVATGDPATQYAIPFQFYEVAVYVNGLLKTNGIDYTLLDGSGAGSTGTLQFILGQEPAVGQFISIIGDQTISQPVDYTDFDDAPAQVYETTVDQLTMMVKELDEKIGRSIRASPFDPQVPGLDFSANPNTIVVIDQNGLPALADPESLNLLDVGVLGIASDAEAIAAVSTQKVPSTVSARAAMNAGRWSTMTDVPSAATCDIGAANTFRVRITGTTTITSLGTVPNCIRLVTFDNAVVLTHNAVTLDLPGTANITTQTTAWGIFVSDASGNWSCVVYQNSNGQWPNTAAFNNNLGVGFWAAGSIASAATTSLATSAAPMQLITGAVTITSFGTGASRFRIIGITGSPLITHNAVSLICPGGQNIQTATGDWFLARSDGSSNWTITHYQRADGTALALQAHTHTSVDITDFTEAVQDVIGTQLGADGGDLDWTYNDAGNTLDAVVKANAISNTKLRDSAALSVIGNATNATADPADITAASDGQVLRRSGTAIGFGAVSLATAAAVTGRLPFANVPQLAGLSVLGVAGNATADMAAITAATDDFVLKRSGTAVGFSGFTQSGTGAVARGWQTKLRDVIDVRDFGVTGNGSTDDTTALQNAINEVAARGGGTVYIPEGFNCKISSTIVINKSHVKVIGAGADQQHDGGAIGAGGSPATKFTWAGGAAGMVRLESPFGASNQVQVNLQFQGIQLDCAGVATEGLRLISVRKPRIVDVFVLNPTVNAFVFTCGITGTNFAAGEAADIQHGWFENLNWRAIDSAGVRSANGMFLTGSVNANVSFNKFVSCIGQTWNGNGIVCESADSNTFIDVVPRIVTGTGVSFDLYGSTAPLPTGGASNYFVGCFWDSFRIRGTDTGFLAGPPNNTILTVDLPNAAPYPTFGTGASANVFYPAWLAYTPTVTPGSGAYTTVTATGKYQRINKMVKWMVTITFTNIGTGGTSCTVSLPTGVPSVGAGVASGQESATGGIQVQGSHPNAATTMLIRRYDAGLFVPVNGNVVTLCGCYESA